MGIQKRVRGANGKIVRIKQGTDSPTSGGGGGSSSGTVTSFVFTPGNGFSGTVLTPATVPTLSLGTTVTGLVKGNGTALSAATAGTDYLVPAAALTTGSVPFANASGQLAQDNANLFWDNTNKRLGLGTTTPSGILSVNNAAGTANVTWTGTGPMAATMNFGDLADVNNFSLWRLLSSTAANTNFKNVPQSFALQHNGTGGIVLSTNTAAPIIFVTGGTGFANERGRFTPAGLFNLASLTASKPVFTDASKNLTSTGPGTSAQFIKGDGSLDSTTYATGTTFREQTDILYDQNFNVSCGGVYTARVAQTVTLFAYGPGAIQWQKSTTAAPTTFGSISAISANSSTTGITLQAGASLYYYTTNTAGLNWAHVQQTA